MSGVSGFSIFVRQNIEEKTQKYKKIKKLDQYLYDICFIGTAHSDRYIIVGKIKDIAIKNDMKIYTFFYLQNPIMYWIRKLFLKEYKYGDISDFSFQPISQNEIIKIYHRVLKGGALADSYTTKKYFPSIVAKMSRVGEESGNLTEVLAYLADFYENEVDNTTKNLSTMLEPALLVFIGLTVGFVAMSIINPIYDLTSQVGR